MTLSRRSFLRTGSATTFATGLAGIGGTSLLGPSAMAANVSGYKALVCVFFFGGLDGHDVLLPYDQTSYDQFEDVRVSLLNLQGQSRARSNLLPLSPDNAADFGGRAFALPPEMPGMRTLFDQGRAAIVPNVGPLFEPTTRQQALDESVALPPRLFSHNDQQSVWQASAPEGAQFGWGGLFADAAINFNANAIPDFTTISGSGNQVFLTGQVAQPYQLGSDGGASSIGLLAGFDDNGGDPFQEQAFQTLRRHFRPDMFGGSNLIQQDIAQAAVGAVDANEQYAIAAENAVPLNTIFPVTSLGSQLKAVADTIAIRNELQVARQVFFVGIGGFDTHDSQAATLPALLSQIDGGVVAFQQAMIELGVANDVTLFTASDFGRTLSVNGDGTDHGWGGHHFVVGGAVQGKRIYGDVPPPVLGHDNDMGSGRLLPSIAVDQYAAPLGRWFGLNESELATALPSLGNFTDPALGYL